MTQVLSLILPLFLTAALFRLLLKPMALVLKLLLYALGGFACLWLYNLCAPITGLAIPINPVTILLPALLGPLAIPVLLLLTL